MVNPQFFVEYTPIGITLVRVFCEALIIPNFGILGGPVGPSGVMNRIFCLSFNILYIFLKAISPFSLLDPLIII